MRTISITFIADRAKYLPRSGIYIPDTNNKLDKIDQTLTSGITLISALIVVSAAVKSDIWKMISYLKEIIGIASDVTDYDLYLVIISAIGCIWIVKTVITGIYSTVLHIFR